MRGAGVGRIRAALGAGVRVLAERRAFAAAGRLQADLAAAAGAAVGIVRGEPARDGLLVAFLDGGFAVLAGQREFLAGLAAIHRFGLGFDLGWEARRKAAGPGAGKGGGAE